jgi:O-6-methylguanine DNA methyltransferase
MHSGTLQHATGVWRIAVERGALISLRQVDGSDGVNSPNADVREHLAAVSAYLEGKYARYPLPLLLQGTPFQLKVWDVLQQIPYGATLSYRDVAERIGAPRAVRAVGTACGANPVAVVVPCHRVLASNGGLGGYAYGLATKQRLLAYESAPVMMRQIA